jgi:hypothetical protein
MKLSLRSLVTVIVVTAAAGCATDPALGIPKVAEAQPDPPPMCVALRGPATSAPVTSTTELTSMVTPVRPLPTPAVPASVAASSDAKAAADGATVKDRRALVFLKGM